MEKRVQKYDRTIMGKCGTPVVVDIYRILAAYNVQDQNVGHAVKKLLCAGIRNGGKPQSQDIDEAIWTLEELQKRVKQEEEDIRIREGEDNEPYNEE